LGLLLNWIDGKKGLRLTPENTYDLWTLRRTIQPGDLVQSWTSREVKIEGEFQRPDRGRRVRVRVKIEVESVRYDYDLGRIRVRGRIVDSDNELVPHGSFHSLDVLPLTDILLWRRDYPAWMIKRLQGRRLSRSQVLIAIDSREAGVGLLSGLTLKVYGTVESGLSGKQYAQDNEKLLRTYFGNIMGLLKSIPPPTRGQIVIGGPGNTKNRLANLISEAGLSKEVVLLDGYDVAGDDGVRLMPSSTSFRELVASTEYAQVQDLIETMTSYLARGDERVALGVERCAFAAKKGAVRSLLLSDAIFKRVDEETIVGLANETEAKGGEAYLLDSSTILGAQVDGLGGAVALLRYTIPTPV